MIKFILSHSIEFLLGLILLTQVIIPMLIGERMFWLFRASKKDKEEPTPLEELEQQADEINEKKENLNSELTDYEEKLKDIRNKQ